MKQKQIELPAEQLIQLRQRCIDQASGLYYNSETYAIKSVRKDADLIVKEAKKIEDYVLGKK